MSCLLQNLKMTISNGRVFGLVIFRLSDYKDEKKPCFVRNRALSLHIKLFQLILILSRKYKRTS